MAEQGIRYYASTDRLDALIADPSADIADVVREAERLCRREAGAAEYYRGFGDKLTQGHPWLEFVKTGEAAYLGWT